MDEAASSAQFPKFVNRSVRVLGFIGQAAAARAST